VFYVCGRVRKDTYSPFPYKGELFRRIVSEFLHIGNVLESLGRNSRNGR